MNAARPLWWLWLVERGVAEFTREGVKVPPWVSDDIRHLADQVKVLQVGGLDVAPPAELTQWVPVKEAARRLGISRQGATGLCKRQTLVCVKNGSGYWMVDERAVKDRIERRRHDDA